MSRKNRPLLSIILLIATLPQPCFAADWRYLTSTADDTKIFVDVSTVREEKAIPIKRPFPVMRIWVKHDHTEDKTVKDRSTVQLMSVNCENDTSMAITSVRYGANGEVAGSRSVEDYDFRYTPDVPDTIGFAITQFACGRSALP